MNCTFVKGLFTITYQCCLLYSGRNCDRTTNGRQIDPESFTLQGKETIKIHEEQRKVLGNFINYLPKQ